MTDQFNVDPVEWGETKQLIKEIHVMVTVQNSRIRKLENWRWLIVGGGTVVVFLVVHFFK